MAISAEQIEFSLPGKVAEKLLKTMQKLIAIGLGIGVVVAGTFLLTSAAFATVPTVVVTSVDGSVVPMTNTGSFVWKIDANHPEGPLTELEVDHSLEGVIDEFTVYANEEDPYGSPEAKAAFEFYGASVKYDEAEQKWTIDFGEFVTQRLLVPSGITFYIEVNAEDGHQFGDMYNVTSEYTFAYTFELYPAPSDKDDCKNGGWYPLFKNQGKCVSSVAK